MPTLLDGVEERHDGPEPRVLTADVRRVLRAKIQPDNPDAGVAVQLIADEADVSTRTVYRVMADDPERPTIGLDLADRLCIAAGSHLVHCRLVWPDERITEYMRVRLSPLPA